MFICVPHNVRDKLTEVYLLPLQILGLLLLLFSHVKKVTASYNKVHFKVQISTLK